MENVMTTKDVLTDVNEILNKINIPISLVESIGIPVARAINGIKICIDAMDRQEQEEAAKNKPQDNEEPVIELVPMEEPEETE